MPRFFLTFLGSGLLPQAARTSLGRHVMLPSGPRRRISPGILAGTAVKYIMSTSPISNLQSSYLQQALLSALQSAGISNNTSRASATPSATTQASDSIQLSPFAQLASALQQLQQSNPSKYAQVTEQISTNLASAAQAAQSQGNTSAAGQLTQLASDFSTASQTGQLPNLQDLSQALSGGSSSGTSRSGGHHHHHHAESSSSDSASTSSAAASGSSSSAAASGSSSSTTNNTSNQLSQLLAALQAIDSQSTQNSSSLSPGAIILQTLSNAGIDVQKS